MSRKIGPNPADKYLFKVKNQETRITCMVTVLVSLLLTLDMQFSAGTALLFSFKFLGKFVGKKSLNNFIAFWEIINSYLIKQIFH